MNINVSHLSYCYENAAEAALSDISLTLTPGWTGIVGSNGAGKSTVLKLLCGHLQPTSGRVMPHFLGTYCPQPTEEPPANLEDFACDYCAEAFRLRALLHIEEGWLWRYDTLSHGERKRIQLACALFDEPAVLALDEPTNHLDGPTRNIVAQALSSFRGIGLLVSHDRALLDSLVGQCLLLDSGSGKVIPGSYSEAKAQADLQTKTAQAKRKDACENLAHLQTESNRRRAEASCSSARRSARHLDKNDHDGRAKIGLAIYSGQDGKAGLLSAQMNKKVEKAEERLGEAHVKKVYTKPLDLLVERSKRSVVAKLTAGNFALGEEKTLHYPDLFVGSADRIGLEGANGSGKSTLLSKMVSELSHDPGVLYIPQEIGREQGRRVLAAAKNLPPLDRGRLLSIVARLNSPPRRILSGDEVSPGELRKLMLAEGLLGSPYLIVMDEPTNHLDLPSIEALQEVLAQCNCALVLVSHDREFIDTLTTTRWLFEEQACGEGVERDSAARITQVTVELK